VILRTFDLASELGKLVASVARARLQRLQLRAAFLQSGRVLGRWFACAPQQRSGVGPQLVERSSVQELVETSDLLGMLLAIGVELLLRGEPGAHCRCPLLGVRRV